MSQDQFQKGIADALRALETGLSDHGIRDPVIECSESRSDPPSVTIKVTANGKTAAQEFSHEEILDSGEAVDAPVSVKARMLVTHFL
jgi:hypothetical protein